MLSQIMLGLLFYFLAYQHYKGKEWMMKHSIKNRWLPEKRRAYQKTLVTPCIMFATLFIIMGIIEQLGLLSMMWFIILYVALAMLILSIRRSKGVRFFKEWE